MAWNQIFWLSIFICIDLNQKAVYILLFTVIPYQSDSVYCSCIPLRVTVYTLTTIYYIMSCNVIRTGIQILLVFARAAKTTNSSYTLLQLLNLNDIGRHDPLKHQLSNPVALLYLIVGVCVVEEENLDGPAVVCVDDAGAGIDEVLGGEARAGSNSAV